MRALHGASKSISVLTNSRGKVMKKCLRRPETIMLPAALLPEG
jgi:hypothetical protein